MSRCTRWLIALLACIPLGALAHKPSDSYLTLTLDDAGMQGRWDIALRDLDFAMGLDANADGAITWGEVRGNANAIHAYAFSHLKLIDRNETHACPLSPDDLLVDEHVDGAYASISFKADCAGSPDSIGIVYSLLSGLDPNHRGLLSLEGSQQQSAVLANDGIEQQFDLLRPDRWQQLRTFVTEGVRHIWLGYDHLLFLFTLLLPSVVVYRNRGWQPRASLRESATDIVKVVSAFTLAHSLTLSLAALDFVELPSRLVESVIALTVLLGAANILFPLVRERRWLLALIFGLIHGLGFAAVLADLGLDDGHLLEALIGFNIGVELGQLAIVAVVMPAVFLIRATAFYRRVALPAGATAIGCLAIYWAVTRAFPVMLAATGLPASP